MEKKKSSTITTSGERSTSKSGKSSTSKGKKAMRQRQKEEEERRLEEEARLRAEQEEKDRKEREARLAQEKKIREKQLIELKNRELTSFYDLVNEIGTYLDEFHKLRRSNFKWLRYMKCDGSPDPSIPKEINTFLSIWGEDADNNRIEDSLFNVDLVTKLIDEIEFLIEDLSSEENENAQSLIERYKQAIKNLENLSLIKIDEASHKALLKASSKIDPETLNFDFSDGDDLLFYCIWANLSHNPKNKEFQFVKKNFSFILPRPLTLANVVIRTLFMNYDFFSSRSKTYACRVKKENFAFDPIPELIPEKVEEKPEEPNEDDLLPPELKALIEKNKEEKEEETEEKKLEIVVEEAESNEEEKKHHEDQKEPISQEELAILQELSDNFVIDLRNFLPLGPIIYFGLYYIPPQTKKIRNWQITQIDENQTLKPFKYPIAEPTLPHASWVEYWNRKLEQEQQQHNSLNQPNEQDELGDTIKSKKTDMNMTIKSNDFLESTIGPDDTIVSDANKQFLKSFLTKSNESLVKMMKNEGPVHINYKLPSNLYFGEAPTLARWDEKKQHWRTDEILDFKYNEELKEIHFKTYHFSPYCLLQDRHVHMPFQLWRMAPREAMNTCMFTIETPNFELNIEIKSNELRVYLPINRRQLEEDLNKTLNSKKLSTTLKQKDIPALPPRQDYEAHNLNTYFIKVIEPIANRWFPFREFQKVLKSIGLNIFPEPDSDKFVTVTNKNKKLEWLTYRNMALCSCLLSFAFSKWNAEINDESKIVVSYQVHTQNKEPNSDRYKCMICTNEVFHLSESDENSEEINQNIMPETEEHADLYNLCLSELCKQDPSLADLRIKQIDPLYYETCLKFLESVKVLTFS